MSSRYPQPGEQRFLPRDRSPTRLQDRRSSTAFNNYQGAGLGTRSLDDNGPPSVTRDIPREPPRGPKALEVSRSSSFAPSGPRGRGFGIRPDYRDRDRDRDREYYESRDGSSFRRDGDRDWGRRDRDFDNRDTRPTYGRGKSRSPLRDRDYRDSRDTRDVDSRLRRESVGTSLSGADSGSLHSRGLSAPRRGRADWDRGRSRGSLFDDRSEFRPRSRSRDRRWDSRDDREWDRNDPRDRFDRRDDDRRSEYNDRPRIGDRWKDNRPPSRAGSATTPSTPHPPPPTSTLPPNADKGGSKEGHDVGRRISSTPYFGSRDSRSEDKSDYFSTRHESSRERQPLRVASPPPPTQVPAFGSLTASTSTVLPPPAASKTLADKASQPQSPSTTSTAATSNISSSASVKPESKIATSQPVHQAPSGPRAERIEKQSDVSSRDSTKLADSWNRNDFPLRPGTHASSLPGKLPPAPASSNPSPDTQEGAQRRDPVQAKSPIVQSIQGRPSSSSPSQPFGRGQTGSPTSAPSRPSASLTSPRISMANIPTGPRAQREPMVPSAPRAVPRGGSLQWISPKAPQYQRGPSIMNTVPPRRDYRPEEKDRPASGGKSSGKSPVSDQSPSERRTILSPRQPSKREEEITIKEEPEANDMAVLDDDNDQVLEKDANLPLSLGQSSDEVGEDDDMDLDEEDFEEAEKKYELDMEALKLRKPASPLRDPHVVDLLYKIQALGILGNEKPEDSFVASMEVDREEIQPQPAPGLLSPAIQEGEKPEPETSQPRFKESPFNRPITPPVSELPFLNTRPLTPFSDIEDVKETLACHERYQFPLRQKLVDRMDRIALRHRELRMQYAALYRPWRLEVEKLDELRRAAKEKEPTPRPISPMPSTTPAVTPAPPEGRRGLKFGSEFDLERVMQESVQTHREEMEKRESEAKARADPKKEAMIPNMKESFEPDDSTFCDVNGLVEAADALHVFRYVPPVDDFTPEEHELFLKAYILYPKKFGKIAKSLPDNRDFKSCIQHYYLTKQEANYKGECQKGTRRKGRRRAPPRARANALMSDLRSRGQYLGEEADNPPMTDTGRPRRAAAPVFGDTPAEPDSSVSGGPTPRRGTTKEPGDVQSEKPASRRTRGGGGGSRGGRKAKAQQQPPPVPAVIGPSPSMAPQISPRKEQQRQDYEGANLLASLHNSRPEERVVVPLNREVAVSSTPSAPESAPTKVPKQKNYSGAQAPTSYWSVPEQNDFPRYVAHFGKDYVAIATHMQTKTPIMVKNYFTRCVEAGRWELEQMAQICEEKRQRGESLGPPPAKTMAQKRRYDTTASTAAHRPLAPSMDSMDVDNAPSTSTSQPQNSPPIASSTHPKIHPLGLPQGGPSSSTQPGTSGEIRPKTQRMMQGPRAGFFTEERKDAPAPTPAQPVRTTQIQPQETQQQLPVQNQQVLQRTEPVHTASWRQAPEPIVAKQVQQIQQPVPQQQQQHQPQQQSQQQQQQQQLQPQLQQPQLQQPQLQQPQLQQPQLQQPQLQQPQLQQPQQRPPSPAPQPQQHQMLQAPAQPPPSSAPAPPPAGPPAQTQSQQQPLLQASTASLRQFLSSHGGNVTVDIVDGRPHTVFKKDDEQPARRIDILGSHVRDSLGSAPEKLRSPVESNYVPQPPAPPLKDNSYIQSIKDGPRPSSTPAQIPEPPRPLPAPAATPAPAPAPASTPTPSQAPTKRINIMSMLNDDVEPQPPKRVKEVHEDSSKTQSPTPAYQPASLPLSRVESQPHSHTPIPTHSHPYSQPIQYAGLQSQHQPQMAQQPPRGSAPYQERSPRWSQSQRTPTDWLSQFDPRPTRPNTSYSPQQAGRNSPPIHTTFAPLQSSALRHSSQPSYQHGQHAPSPPPPPQAGHPSHYRSASHQHHVRIPSIGHQPSPTVGPQQHPSQTGPPPVPNLPRHPYGVQSPTPQPQRHGPPHPPPRHGSREYLMYPAANSATVQPPLREYDLREQSQQAPHIHELARRAELERRQPGRTYTPPGSGPWNLYGGDRGAGPGSGPGSGPNDKREIY